jgi:CBS domain-containing protein
MSEKRFMRVGDLMVSKLLSVDGLATVAEVMALMKRHRVSSIAVNRRNEDDELGLVVVSDVARQVIARNRAPERVNVYEIMSKPVLTLPAEMLARYAVRLLVRFGLSRAVVVDHDRSPLGMVTLRDLVMGHVEDV